MGFEKGHKKLGGRQKGATNKVSADVKDALVRAVESAHPRGMQGFFEDLVATEPVAIAQGLFKLLPKDVNVEIDGGLVVQVVRKFVKAPSA